MDRGAWSVTVHGITKSQTRQQLTLSLNMFYAKLCNYLLSTETLHYKIVFNLCSHGVGPLCHDKSLV